MAPVPEVHELHTDVVERRLLSGLTRSLLLAFLLAVARGVAFGQDTMALSSGNAVEGGSIALNLSLSSAVGSEPAGIQWTLTYSAANVASIDAVAGSSAAAANETIACFAGAGSYTCLLSGMNDEAMQNGVVAVINVTMTSSAVATPISLTNVVGATAAGSPISMTGTGGTIALPSAAAPGTAGIMPSVDIDAPVQGATVSGMVTVSGWAIDNTGTIGTAISAVQVLVDGTAVGTATYGLSRPDVCYVYPGRAGCPNVGYSYSLNTAALSAGSHTITVEATDSSSPPDTGSASVVVNVTSIGPPSVWIDSPVAGAAVSGTITVNGWAMDNRAAVGTAIGSVQVFVDGAAVGNATYGLSRPDVCYVYPGRPGCPNVGFSFVLNTAALTPGSHTIMVTATDSDNTPDTGSASVVVNVTSIGPPSVWIDSPIAGAAVSGTITVSGWAMESRAAVGTAIGSVQVFVDGAAVGNATYGLSRPDVCYVYPGRPGCPNVGFSFALNTAALTPGSHTIVVTATDTANTPDTGSATAVVNVIGPPSVWIDSPVAGAAVSGTVTVNGWAMESRAAVGTAIGSVRVFVDGTAVGNATYGLSRPDVCYVYPGRPGCPNVGFSFALNTAALTPGSHTIVVTATDTASPPVTGSASVTVTAGSAGMTPSAAVAAPAHGAFTSLHCTPASLTSGETSACTVTLSSPAGSGGLTVTLASSAAALTVPGSVTVAAGASMATFAASAGAVASAQTAVVTASWNTASETASIGLQPASSQSGASIACNPDSNKVGGLDCGVSLAQAAPASGVTVALQANTSRVQVPAQVSIAAGALSARFAAAVISSDQDAQAQITASVQGALTTATIPITGIRPTSLSCAPQTVQAGGFFTCTVGMNNPNVLQVARLAVSSSSPSLELPSPFMTRPGQAQLSFEVFTTPFAGQQSSAVTVQFGETAVTSTVEVTPATAPILNLPGTQMAAFGKPMSFAISAVDPGGLPLTLSAANLPPGASFDPATGEFRWTPQAPSSLNQRLGASSPLERREVTFTATNSARKSSTGSVTIEADPGLPVITGLRNAASQQSQAVLPKERVTAQPTPTSCSPGSLASLLGRWLGAGAQPTASPTGSSTELEGAAVIVNGNPAPVVYASATRVDFLCPEALPGGELEISAQVGGTVTNVIHANQQATLGLFSADGSGQGQAMVTLSGTSLLATPRSYLNDGQPAEPGDTISILATGAGLDAGPALVEVSIGGVSTTADRVQPMPGMAGVYQVDVTVPASVAPGDAVPIAIEIADSSGIAIGSNTVTIAVEARQLGQP
jgi:uncharacterized protein (TIGR03437 family)